MRVLFITHNYPRTESDYSGVFLRFLAGQLKRHDVQVTVLAPRDAGLPEFEEVAGIPVYRFRYGTDSQETFAYRGDMHRQLMRLSGPFRLWRFLRSFRLAALKLAGEQKFDLIAAHWAVPSAPVALSVSQAAGIPLVVHSHGTDVRLLSQTFLARWFARKALKHAGAWTTVSSYLKELASESFPALSDKIQVAPLPTDANLFCPKPEVTRNPQRIVSVTRFVPQKRVNLLLSALAQLKERQIDFELELYGAGPLERELKQALNNLNLTDHVSLRGPVSHSELPQIYSSASVVVLNSIKEGFGLTLVEGALCGAMPVGVDSGGIPDIIDHHKTGLLALPDNAESLAAALEEALNNTGQTSTLAQAARENAQTKFTGPAVAKRYADIYRAVVSE